MREPFTSTASSLLSDGNSRAVTRPHKLQARRASRALLPSPRLPPRGLDSWDCRLSIANCRMGMWRLPSIVPSFGNRHSTFGNIKRFPAARKPNSVGPDLRRDGRPFLWDDRCRSPQATYPRLMTPRARTCGTNPIGFVPLTAYLVLLPVGFAIAADVTTRAVRSYRTFSPLPLRAVSFLLHFPSACAAWRLSSTVHVRSSDFPHPDSRRDAAAWAAGKRVHQYNVPTYV
jgi:hypothetical protein